MEARLPDRVERDVMRAHEADWLRLWAHQGWVTCGEPVVCGRSPTGDDVHRHTLAHMPSAEWAPSIPWIELDVVRLPMQRTEEAQDAPLVLARGGVAHMLPTFSALARLTARRRGQHELPMEA
jgi:hypothetical protein